MVVLCRSFQIHWIFVLVVLTAAKAAVAMPATDLAGARDPDVGNTGAYSFSIPIDSPVGTGSFQPNIGLRYSSNGGGGAFGIGWQLSLGEIRRSTRFGTPAYDATDQYELDGELLVENLGNGDYHTIRESNSRTRRISQTGDLDYWEVTFPNGTIGRYGKTANSRVDHATLAESYRWLLAELEDVHGNQIQFAYDATDVGSRYPASITYTYRNGVLVGNVERRIEFELESRPDPAVSYVGGLRQEMNHRITEIVSTVDGNAFRRRVLEYDSSSYSTNRSRITASQLFGDDCDPSPPNSTQAACAGLGLPRETYQYRDHLDTLPNTASSQWSASATWNSPVPFTTGNRDNGARIADVNGDGRSDVLHAMRDENGIVTSKVYLAGDSGWSEDAGWSVALGNLAFDFFAIVGRATAQHPCRVPGYSAHSDFPVVFEDRLDWSQLVSTNTYLPPVFAQVVDVNGDGLTDILVSMAIGGTTSAACGNTPHGKILQKVFTNDGNSWVEDSARSAGLPPFYEVGSRANYPPVPLTVDPNSPAFVDINGDGLLDVVVGGSIEDPGFEGFGTLGTWLNSPNQGWSEAPSYAPPYPMAEILRYAPNNAALSAAKLDTGVRFADLNGDGLVDIAKLATDGIAAETSHGESGVHFNTGTGWCDPLTECATEAARYSFPSSYASIESTNSNSKAFTTNGVRLIDINGDGVPDFVRADSAQSGVRFTRLGDPGGASFWGADSPEFEPPVSLVGETFFSTWDLGVRIVDVDNDGALDFVQSYDNDGTAIESQFASVSAFPNLVSAITNGTGGSVAVEYESAIAQRDDSTGGLEEASASHAAEPGVAEGPGTDGSIALWPSAPVVSSITVAGIGANDTFQLKYAGPRWCPNLRSRLGYRIVERERPDGSFVRRYHWQHHGRAGRVAKVEVLDPADQLVSEATYDWVVLDGGATLWSTPGVFIGRLTEVTSANRYGGSKGAETTATLSYNDASSGHNFVNEITEVRPSGTLVVQRTRHVDSNNAALVGLIALETRRADTNTGRILSLTAFGHLSGRGSVTSTTTLARDRDDSQGLNTETTLLAYDAYGNTISVTDPLGRVTRLCWDGAANGCPSAATATFSVSTGALEPAPFSGLTSVSSNLATGAAESVTEFNGDETGTTPDAFGRPMLVTFTPSGGSSITIGSSTYFDGPGQPYVESCTRVSSGGTDEICGRAYQDGLGRVVRTSQDVGSNTSGGILFAGRALKLDYAGRPIRQTLPTSCSTDPSCTGIDADRVDRVVVNEYDALGRGISNVIHRVGGVQEIQAFFYSQTTRSAPVGGASLTLDVSLAKDADGILTQRLADRDRLVWVDECSASVASSVASLTGSECSSPDETYYTYEPTGELATVYDSTGLVAQARHRISYFYDTVGRVRFIEDPDGGTREMRYHANGLVHESINGRLQKTTYGYDELGRLESAASPERTINVLYAHSYTRAPSRETVTGEYSIDLEYDDLGRTTSQVLTIDTVPAGMPQAARIDMDFDLLGRPTAIDYPVTGTRVGYAYSGPNLKSVCVLMADGSCQQARSYITDATYDGLGRVEQLKMSPGDLDYTYDSVTDRLEQEALSFGGVLDVSYGYTSAGRVNSITDGVGTGLESASASFAYDARGRLDNWTRSAASPSETFHFSYDPLGNLTGRDLASGSGPANQAYSGTRPHAITSRTVGAQTLQYEYDADGNMTRRDREGALTQHLGWNSSGQLTCIWTSSGCDVAEFGYNLAGNRIYERTAGGGLVVYIGELASYSSDRTAEVRIWALGRQIAVEDVTGAQLRTESLIVLPNLPRWFLPSLLLLITAGGLGGLILSVHRLEVVPGFLARPIAGSLSLAISASLIVLPAPAFAGGGGGGGPTLLVRWIFANHLGTGIVYTNQYGTVVRRRVVEPFGRVIHEDAGGTEDPSVVFTGKQFHEDVGLYYFGARWHDPEIARFVSVDPIVPSPGDPQNFNGYSYVRNDPVNLVDPTGAEPDVTAASWQCNHSPSCAVSYYSQPGAGGGTNVDTTSIAAKAFAAGAGGGGRSGGGGNGGGGVVTVHDVNSQGEATSTASTRTSPGAAGTPERYQSIDAISVTFSASLRAAFAWKRGSALTFDAAVLGAANLVRQIQNASDVISYAPGASFGTFVWWRTRMTRTDRNAKRYEWGLPGQSADLTSPADAPNNAVAWVIGTGNLSGASNFQPGVGEIRIAQSLGIPGFLVRPNGSIVKFGVGEPTLWRAAP